MNAAIDRREREPGPDRAADLPRDLARPRVDPAAEDVPDDEQQQRLLGDRGGELALLALPAFDEFCVSGHARALPGDKWGQAPSQARRCACRCVWCDCSSPQPPRRLRLPPLPLRRHRRLAVRGLARHAHDPRHRRLRRRQRSAARHLPRRRSPREDDEDEFSFEATPRSSPPPRWSTSPRPAPAPSTTGATRTTPSIERRERERRASQYIRA